MRIFRKSRNFLLLLFLCFTPASSLPKSRFRSGLDRPHCRCIRSRRARSTVTSGRQATGRTVRWATTGFLAFGWRRRAWDCCGRRAIGDLPAASMAGMRAIGDLTSASTAASTTALAMAAWASWEAMWSGGVFRYNTAVMNVNTVGCEKCLRQPHCDQQHDRREPREFQRRRWRGRASPTARMAAQHEQHFQPTVEPDSRTSRP